MQKLLSKKNKAFSLVELLVAMAIIASLMALVAVGIGVAQRNGRDSARRTAVSNMELLITEYQAQRNSYPATATGTASNDPASGQVSRSTGNPATSIYIGMPTNPDKELELSGAQVIDTTLTATSTAANAQGTRYCYAFQPNNGGYVIGTLLESGGWFYKSSGGGAAATCSANLI